MTIPIPPEALEDAGIVLGRRGAGKSNILMTLFEHELDAGHRAVMVDPKGDRFGIRLQPDGSPSRFTIPIFGGDHADIKINEGSGEEIGRLVAEHDLSCLIDPSRMSLQGKQHFMMGFAPTLLHHNRAALTLFLEEVDQFANQDPRYQPAMLVHHIANFATLGRQRGIVPWVASQRPAKVNATVRSQADTFIAMKVTSPLDRKAYSDWFEGHSKAAADRIKTEVGSLQPGEALIWVGATEFFDKVQFPMASTYDSGRTPKQGERIADIELPAIDLVAIHTALVKVETDKKPGKNIPENIPGGDKHEGSVCDSAQVSRLLARIVALEAERDEWSLERSVGQQQLDALADENRALREIIGNAMADMARIKPALEEAESIVRQVAPAPPAQLPARQPVPARAEQGDLTKGARKMVEALAKHYPRSLPIEHVAKIAGVSTSSSQWRENRRSFEACTLVAPHGDDWRMTNEGVAHLGLEQQPDNPAALLAFWMRALPSSTGNMLKVLVHADGVALTKEEVAREAGVSLTSSGLAGGLRELRTHGLIEAGGAGFRATKVLL